jgi:hypothetical protein
MHDMARDTGESTRSRNQRPARNAGGGDTSRSRNQRPAVDADADEVAVSHNDELRMFGHTGDDEEDVMGGQEELFGLASAAQDDPIDVEEEDATAGDEDEHDTQSTAGNKRTRSCTSDVWDDFEKIFKVVNGKKIRFRAKCNHCD